MSIDYVVIRSASAIVAAPNLPDAPNWRQFDGYLQYQGSREFILNMYVLSAQEYQPPKEIREKMGSEFVTTAVIQEGGYSSKSAGAFLEQVFEVLAEPCEKVAIDSPAGMLWIKK